MIGAPNIDRMQRRRAATKAEIVAAAWLLAAEVGVGGINVRELASRVGLKAPSLYGYFPSKHAVYDAMFADGWSRFRELMASLPRDGDLRAEVTTWSRALARHWVSQPERFSLMCQRPIPGFEPSPAAYAIAAAAVDDAAAELARRGVEDPRAVDMLLAIISGVVAQQIANQPGGERWILLCDDAAGMFVHWVQQRREARR